MQLTTRLNSPHALFRKLERESYRAYHAPTPLHKADHFFNFCVTASSMRDYCLEYLGAITKAQRQPHYDAWSKVPLLVAAAEIGNSAKHFVLRDPTGSKKPVKTRGARMKPMGFVDVYEDTSGQFHVVPITRTEVMVTLSDGTKLQLYSFTEGLLAYWKQYLSSIGVRIRRQPFKSLRPDPR
jgi:hypothetical protein